jgi:hypothetical protein
MDILVAMRAAPILPQGLAANRTLGRFDAHSPIVHAASVHLRSQPHFVYLLDITQAAPENAGAKNKERRVPTVNSLLFSSLAPLSAYNQ